MFTEASGARAKYLFAIALIVSNTFKVKHFVHDVRNCYCLHYELQYSLYLNHIPMQKHSDIKSLGLNCFRLSRYRQLHISWHMMRT